jgi:hypothetical protein
VESGVCVSDTRSCSASNATAATETWTGSAYGTCTASACASTYHLEFGACVSDTRSCSITNGTGSQSYASGAWGTCTVASCNSTYHQESNTCVSNTRTCSPMPANASAGTQLYASGAWGSCTISACSSGYALAANACTASAASCSNQTNGSQVVISQVYGGGGNTSALYKNDFIELHNRGNTAVDLNGWSVQYASSSGTSWTSITAIGTKTIAPGGYLLIAGSGGTVGSNLPTADVTGTINLSSTSGKVILVSSTTITGALTCPTGATIRDHVSFGTSTACDGSPTQALSNITAAIRTESCTGPSFGDTNVNSADFTVAAPAPRNSMTTPVSCSCTGP